MVLTTEQFQNIENRVQKVFVSFDKKNALLLARKMEKELPSIESLNPNAKKDIAELKWLACGLIVDNEELLKLIRENFLEGLTLDEKLWPNSLLDLVAAKLEDQFGVNLEETIQQILEALQGNNQVLGSGQILVKNETTPRPATVRRWLLDFLRSSPESPTEMDETDYLFNNPNAQNLTDDERKLLGQTLAFYDTLRLALRELAKVRTQERVELESYLPPEETPPRPFAAAKPAGPPLQTQKTLREAVQENKEIFNQLLTINPIKIDGAEELVGPILRNWLTDYVKTKGARLHAPQERNDYLANNQNAKKLPAAERGILAEILKAYDEPKTLLPFSEKNRQILIDELRRRNSNQNIGQPKRTIPPAEIPSAFSASSADRYREPVSQKDSTPQNPAPRPAPRVSGNVIDLKDFKE